MMYTSQFRKNWPLWLVLWSRVTFYISQCVFYFNIFCCCFFSQWYHPKIGLSTKGKKHIIFKSHCTLYLICHLIMCVIQTWYLHILVKRKILSQTVINRHIQYRYDMWLYSAHFHPQTCHEHNWNCYCELFMVIWFGGALRLIKVWFDYVLFAFYCGGAGGESTLRKLRLWAPRFALNILWNSPCQHSSSKSNKICQHGFHELNKM